MSPFGIKGGADAEGTEGVDHHRHLLGAVLVGGPLDAAGLGAVDEAARVEGDRCCIDLRTVLGGEDDALQDAIEAAALASKTR